MAKHRTCAIIVAAGRSTRMGQNKQLINIGDTTVIDRCLQNFQNANTIDDIVVVTSPDLLAYIKEIAPPKVHAVIEGGATRQESVCRGLEAVPQNCRYLAIHDGARPFASPDLIDHVNRAAYENGAAAPVIPVTSTVKLIDDTGKIVDTVDRDRLRLVQTPQCFDREQYKTALSAALAENADLTDDCQLFERRGWTVVWVEGSECNIKLTTPVDIALAQIIGKRMDDDENRNRI